MNKVAVIGAAGHVGLPFSLILASVGYEVVGIDVSAERCELLNHGYVTHKEEGAVDLLKEHKDNITFTTDQSKLSECDVVAIMIGTPVDGEGNPRVDDIIQYVDFVMTEYLTHDTLILLRSTVAPGTTELVRNIIERTGLVDGKDFYLAFAPERVVQGFSIKESRMYPQLIGTFNQASHDKAAQFFKKITHESIQLTAREAEFAKLITNMYRYVNFAFANEMYMIGTEQGVDVHKVIKAANKNYKRMNMPLPGPNVGGPCLFKDGKFLLEDTPYGEIIQSSFLINEGMPKNIFNKIRKLNPDVRNIAILGMTFKADCDDPRNSLSFKFAKICKRHGVEYKFFDPFYQHVDNLWPLVDTAEFDAFVVMTPHTIFQEFYDKYIANLENKVIADAWKFLFNSQFSPDGVYKINDTETSV